MRNFGTVTLQTKRLIIRKPVLEDAFSIYHNVSSDKSIYDNISWIKENNIEDTKENIINNNHNYENKLFYHWIIELKSSKEIIGKIGLNNIDYNCADIGYCISSKYCNNGYATEALIKVIDFLLNEVGLNAVMAKHYTNNVKSGKVMKKASMKWIAETDFYNGKHHDQKINIYQIRKDNFMDRKIETFLELIYKPVINNSKFTTFGYQEAYKENENIDLGYIDFIDSIKPNEIVDILPDCYKTNRNGVLKTSTEFVCVHDTASGAPSANANAHRNWLNSMANDKENTNTVSWHFTVGDQDIIQHLPLDEVGHHAGDGITTPLEFIDSGIKVDVENPIITIGEDGYFYINNKKSIIKAPLKDNGEMVQNNELPYQGIGYILDTNYKLSNTWWSKSYKTLANHGGNLNSIGIETCVNVGSNYIKTMRNTAELVAKLLIQYHLDISRVKQHNYFSGKDCPMTLRHSHRWEEFIKLVEIKKYFLEELSDYKIKFESLTPEYLDNTGTVINYEEGAICSYMVTVEKDGKQKEYVYKCKLGPKNF